jgi:hypothetical protein
MYINQIDDIIDKILDKLFLMGLNNDKTFQMIVESKKINFVEYRDKINLSIQQFIETINITEIQKIITSKENLVQIVNIIKRYVAYYYFLSLAFYYSGTIKDFRNNLIQYSKLQETSTFTIKNFFDTENNYQLIKFFKLIKDISNIITMSDLQKKTLNQIEIKDAVELLNRLGKDYVDNFLLMIVKRDEKEIVEINVHNLIKTIVFGELYRNQERKFVFEMLNEIEESEYEYTYIDIIVSADDITDFNNYIQLFEGEERGEVIARDLFELVNEITRIPIPLTQEIKNNYLLKLPLLLPIVDDFLRYHKETEKIELDIDKTFNFSLISGNNAKNIQMALLYQQRNKTENTKAQLIINMIDAVSNLYSENVKNNPEILSNIKKYFYRPLTYRKAVLHNYLDEVKVTNKIMLLGRKAIESNEYYLELIFANHHAYFNFKDFQKYGVTINLFIDRPINLIRYANIEFINQFPQLELDMRTATSENMINLVGLALNPLNGTPIQCIHKEDLIDIRTTKINYKKNGKTITKISENGFQIFLKIMKHFYINTINVETSPFFRLYHDFSEVKKLNNDIFDKVIYWIYDIEKDDYEMETYENLKTYSFQEIIKLMNSIVYDKIIQYLYKRLIFLVKQNSNLSISDIELLINLYSSTYHLFLKHEDTRELIINQYLRLRQTIEPVVPKMPDEKDFDKPKYVQIDKEQAFSIYIDITNPLLPRLYHKLDIYRETGTDKELIFKDERRCQHEIEWNTIQKLKFQNLNKYNSELTQFIEKYAIETTLLEFICKICGQMLSIRQYVQDGKFDNNTQKFLTAYIPMDIPLEEIKEYTKYKLTIRYLDILINRFSLITGTNMLVGSSNQVKQKRKALVKNIVDIILKHNNIILKKKQSDEERLDFFSRKFNVDKDLDSLYFFELNDSIFNFTIAPSNVEAQANRLKYNNILLYFILIFVTELNGIQISMMYNDKIANIHTFRKYGHSLFGNLLIKKNINDMETIPIIKYPILCYLIFVISYYLIKYKLWYSSTDTKKFNPYYQKIIIHSIVSLFNSISMEAYKASNDYVYTLTVGKLYAQLNSTFRNKDIITLLERNHARWSPKKMVQPMVTKDIIKKYSIKNPIQIVLATIKLPTFKIGSGFIHDLKNEVVYQYTDSISDITNCPQGSYHKWEIKDTEIKCSICGEKGNEVFGTVIRLNEAYYYNLNKIANRRCLIGSLHDFVGKEEEGQIVCKICKRKLGVIYTKEELDNLALSLNKMEDVNAKKRIIESDKQKQLEMEKDNHQLELVEKILLPLKNNKDNLFSMVTELVDNLIRIIEQLIGKDIILDIEKYPIRLDSDLYIIDHTYTGSALKDVIILSEKEERINFRENHPYFKTDVYFYFDNKTQTEVFYHAVTLQLLGYKERHKDYVTNKHSLSYLKISPSVKNRILNIGYETKYIDVSDVFMQNSKTITDKNQNYFQILDNLIKNHILKTKNIVDRIVSTIYKVRYYRHIADEVSVLYLQTSQKIDKLIAKYSKMLENINLKNTNSAFEDWNTIKNYFIYDPINWIDTNVRPSENLYVNSNIISYYDVSSNMMFYYLISEMLSILESNQEKIIKTNICQFYIEIMVYIYDLYNQDKYKEAMEIKRFDYILNGSNYMVDILRKGQGLIESRELEEHLDSTTPDILDTSEITEEEQEELEDLREEAEALDVESDYWSEDDDEDTFQEIEED